MIFQSTSGRIVNKRVKRQGRWRIVPWFRFDKDGFATIDESKINSTDLSKLKSKFRVFVPKVEEKPLEEQPKLSYKDLQKAYTKATGNTGVGKKTNDMLKEMEEL